MLCADFNVQNWKWPGDKRITSDNVDLSSYEALYMCGHCGSDVYGHPFRLMMLRPSSTTFADLGISLMSRSTTR